jgi:lipoprotein-anchoring transpeptidase ErfK/SrfK
MRRPLRPLVALALGLTLFLAACSGGDRPTLSGQRLPTSTPTTQTATTQPPLPAGYSYIAQATVPSVAVYDSPGAATPSQQFANPWYVNDDNRYPVNTVFLVEKQQGDWVQVLLPVRPNGTTGWVKSTDVHLVPNRYKIVVNLSQHKLQALDAGKVFLEDTVAVGKASTPTPVGEFYIRVLLKAPDPTTVYGPYAYGLSSHSETLDTFNGGDAEIGIHGNNDASVLGQNVSSGCIRMDNDKITLLTSMLPLGTPVEITN